jgi:hypothetical protein
MKNFIKKNWYFIAIIIILIVWSVFNIIYDIQGFFKASLFNVFTIFVTSFFAYVLTGNKESSNRKRRIAESFIEKLLDELDYKMYVINDENDVGYIRITQRSIFSHIKLLKEILDKLEMKEEIKDVEYIQERFDNYWTFVSEHIDQKNYLRDSKTTLQNIIVVIRGKLENILTNLYIK